MPSHTILVAEDNPDDALILRMRFRRALLPHNLHIVDNGQVVIDWLSGTGGYSDRVKHPLPDQILLDLKMPVKDGFETLEWIRNQVLFKDFPVVILSSSDDPKDVKRASALGATKYFVKSPHLQNVIDYLQTN